MTMTRFVLN